MRWARFSLKTLLVSVSLLAVFLAWKVSEVRRQQAVVKAVNDLGGSVGYDYEFNMQTLGRLPTGRQPFWPTWIVDTLGHDYFHHVVQVELSGVSVTDDDLALLKQVQTLRVLRLMNTDVTEERVHELKREMPGLAVMHPHRGSLGVLLASNCAVLRVIPVSPADHSGIQPGDVIRYFGGTSVVDRDHLIYLVTQRDAGDKVGLGVRRGTENLKLRVKLADLKELIRRW